MVTLGAIGIFIALAVLCSRKPPPPKPQVLPACKLGKRARQNKRSLRSRRIRRAGMKR